MSPLIYEIVVYAVEALISGIFLLNILEAKFHKILQLIVWCQIVVLSLFVKYTRTKSFKKTENAHIKTIELNAEKN